MSEDRNGKTYSFDICSKCKLSCCQDANPPVTLKRRQIIINFLNENKMPAENIFVRDGHPHPATDAQKICVLYNKETKRCSVHQVKPETCKAGPITFDLNLQKGKVEWFLKKEEICAFAETLYQNKAQFEKHFEVAKAEILRLICDLDSGALKTILKIPEPKTFKIGEDELPKGIIQKLKN